MDVTVTIANWNRADLLRRCLESVFLTDVQTAYEVIVVDNASTDDSVSMVRSIFPAVRVIRNSRNVGFGKAHNQAIAAARGRYVLVLNNDAQLKADTLPTLIEFMDRTSSAGICTCMETQPTPSRWSPGMGMRCFPTVSCELAIGLLELLAPPWGIGQTAIVTPLARWLSGCRSTSGVQEAEVAWAGGALLLLRKSMLDRIGSFDERFFLFFEETDLCLRARTAGWTAWWLGSTSYEHIGSQSVILRTDREELWQASGSIYFTKHGGKLTALFFSFQHYLVRRVLLRCRRGVWATLSRGLAHFLPRSMTDLDGTRRFGIK